MAKRIAVVLSQSPRQDPARRDLEETLVAQLLMEDNLEVTIIPHLEHLDAEATGLLYLEGVSGDMILLGPQHPLDMHRQLAERNVHGRFGRTQQTRDLPPSKFPPGQDREPSIAWTSRNSPRWPPRGARFCEFAAKRKPRWLV